MKNIALISIPILGTFENWGIDFLSLLNPTSQENKFIVITTKYVIKWVEFILLKATNDKKVDIFLYENIITRFDCSLKLVSDIGENFVKSDI